MIGLNYAIDHFKEQKTISFIRMQYYVLVVDLKLMLILILIVRINS